MRGARELTAVGAAVLLAACASYSGSGLVPGQARVADVQRVMGAPAMTWRSPDGSRQLAYPRGPAGYHTFMVSIGADGRLQRIENVLEPRRFALVRPGMGQDEVLRLLGPPEPAWTAHFAARDELVWEWRYCDDLGQLARFDVLFDARQGTVRSTQSLKEWQVAPYVNRDFSCSR